MVHHVLKDPIGLRIAVLGWGSLLWDPRGLRVATAWELTDLVLPLEFSRISGGNRLTLVIDTEKGIDCHVYYALSSFRELDDAVADLMEREQTDDQNNIAIVRADRQATDPLHERTRRWTTRRGLHATIWSAFGPNFQSKSKTLLGTATPFSVEAARAFLGKLKASAPTEFAAARRYIANAPSVVQTPLRLDLDAHGWP